MSILERIASLEATVEALTYRLNMIANYNMDLIFIIIGGLGAIAYLIIKKP